jgi:hypothetical protein
MQRLRYATISVRKICVTTVTPAIFPISRRSMFNSRSLNSPRDAEAATLAPRFEDARLPWKEGTDSRKQAVSV